MLDQGKAFEESSTQPTGSAPDDVQAQLLAFFDAFPLETVPETEGEASETAASARRGRGLEEEANRLEVLAEGAAPEVGESAPLLMDTQAFTLPGLQATTTPAASARALAASLGPVVLPFAATTAGAGRASAEATVAEPGVSAQLALPSDDLFSQQWHLQNNTPGLLDLNLTEVWDGPGQTYTGAGVYVAIMDDGLQRSHHDLDANYSIARDWDFRDSDTDPSPSAGDNHGTAVAGIIGANRDGNGAVGIAYDSTIFGYRVGDLINDFLVTTMTDAADYASGAGGGGAYQADVMNMSYGTMYSGNWYDNALNTAGMNGLNAAFNNGVANGRGGLGTVYVKAAGNSRGIDHDANASSWNANRSTISVAAVNQDGFVSSYSTHGANILVSGFGTPGQVVTTDRTGGDGYNGGANPDYTFGFNGTSAAAPMVSGVIALMLEANPNLGWRDVQDILAYSARHVGTDVGGGTGGSEQYAWQFNNAETWNGGGLHFSRDYGFGLVDAHAAVRMAETWGDNPPATGGGATNSQTSANNVRAFRDLINIAETVDGVAFGGDTAGTSGTESYSFNTTTDVEIEHVTLEMSFSHTDMGDVEITITSPDGTVHQVINDIGENQAFNGRWTFTTNAFWGENSAGDWTITLRDDAAGDEWRITDMDFSAWGSTNTADDTYVFTNEYSDYDGLFGHTTTISAGGGVDTLNAAAVTSNTTIDLASNTGTIDGVAVQLTNINRVFTGDGNDTVTGDGVSALISTGRGNDTVTGGNAAEEIFGGDGNDDLSGGGGDDTILGGAGSDTLEGGAGVDTLRGEGGNDTFRYTAGDAPAGQAEMIDGGGGSFDRILLAGGGTFDFGSDFNVLSIEEIEFEALTGTDATMIMGNKELDQATEFATNLRIDGNSTSNSDETIIINLDFTDNLDISGWIFQDWNLLANNTDLIEINGNANANTITGTSQVDVIDAGVGQDTVDAGDGDDIIIDSQTAGSSNADAYDGGAGNDTLINNTFNWSNSVTFNLTTGQQTVGAAVRDTYANIENVTFSGNANAVGDGNDNILIADDTFHSGANTIEGMAGNDTIVAGAGNDEIDGGIGQDTVDAGDGDDIIIDSQSAGASNADVYDGGAGNDTLRNNTLSWANSVTFNLLTGQQTVGVNVRDTYANIENVTFSGNANAVGDNGDNILIADDTYHSGENTIEGMGGNDTILAGAGNDEIDGGSGQDTVDAGDGDDIITDSQSAGAGDADVYDGGAGNDTLVNNTINWVDTVTFNLFTGEQTVGVAVRDTYANIENLTFSGNANAVGDNGDNILIADDTFHSGDNTIDGMGGDDTILAGAGNDEINGGSGVDNIDAGAGDDIVFDTDFVNFDVMDGGAGIDTIDYSGVTFGAGIVTINLGAGLTSVSGGNTETILNFENVNGSNGGETIRGSNAGNVLNGNDGDDTILGLGGADTLSGGTGDDTLNGGGGSDDLDGGIGDDRLIGGGGWDTLVGAGGADFLNGGGGQDTLQSGGGDDVLIGGGGNDTLNGGGGDDRLRGGNQKDILTGGTGADIFDFNRTTESTVGANRDRIKDFDQGTDRIDLLGIDANTGIGGNQAFTFIGAGGFSGSAGELRYSNAGSKTFVRGDVDGDGSADFEIQLDGTIALLAGDFLL